LSTAADSTHAGSDGQPDRTHRRHDPSVPRAPAL